MRRPETPLYSSVWKTVFAHRVLLGSIIAVLAFWSMSASSALGQENVSEDESVDFVTVIKPILEAKCLYCHGPDEEEGGFRVDDRDTVMAYIDLDEPEYSDLYWHLTGENELMPPASDGGPLPPAQVSLFRQWIVAGAGWPEGVVLQAPSEEVAAAVQAENLDKAEQDDRAKGSWVLASEILGLLHPVLLHFPVALLIAGAFFGLIGFRSESPLADTAYYCLWLAAWMSILACASGWFFAIYEGRGDWQKPFDINDSIVVHRWGGIAVAVLAFVVALIASSSRRRDPYGSGLLWKFLLVLLAAFTGFVSHHGGKMTHVNLHDNLNRKTQILIRNISSGQADAGDDDASEEPPTDDASSDDANSGSVDAEGNGDEPIQDEGSADTSGESDDEASDGAESDEDGDAIRP